MKALTLTCPWAHAVAHWGKTIENRTWLPPRELFGQRLAIHAGKSPFRVKASALEIGGAAAVEFDDALSFIRRADNGPHTDSPVLRRLIHERSSAILCVATVAGLVTEDQILIGTGPEVLAGYQSKWLVGPYGWVLTDVVTLATPVPCAGKQGLWALPPDVEAAVMGQVNHGR